MKFANAVRSFLAAAPERSAAIYHRRLGRVLPALGALDVEEVTPARVAELLRGLQTEPRPGRPARPASAATRKATFAMIRAVLRHAGVHALDRAKLPSGGARAREPRPLSPQEAGRLLQVLDLSEPGDAGLAVLLATGLRLGELLALGREDFDPELKLVHVDAAKTARGRTVDVPDWALGAVEAWVGCGEAERPGDRTIRRRLADAVEEAGLRCAIRVHDLRHARAFALLGGGAPVVYAQEQLGHATPGFTLAVYGRLADGAGVRRTWANTGRPEGA